MPSFVLVHGSGQNAASWVRVAGPLRSRGHAVVAPDLPKHAAAWGLHVRQQFGEDPEMFSKDWIAAGPRWFDETQQHAVTTEFLFHDCDAETAAWALDSVESYDTRKLITEPSPFTAWPPVPTASIVATLDRTISPAWGRKMTRCVLGKEAVEIDAGHCPQVSRPDEVVGILEGLAAASR